MCRRSNSLPGEEVKGISNITVGHVNNEDCNLEYWWTGSGPLIVFIPGVGGHGRQFDPIMARLAHRFTCATFDRRQMSSSRVETPRRLNIPEQARDVLAIIEALGFEKATLFGSSLGGIIALQFALDFPEHVEHVISHEAPTILLLPDASKMFEWLVFLDELKDQEGYRAAELEYVAELTGYHDDMPRATSPEDHNVKNFWENEALMMGTYVPNMWQLRQSGVSVGVMTGRRSGDAFYARATYEQEKILGCLRMDVPGHHHGFESEVDAFVPELLDMFERLKSVQTNILFGGRAGVDHQPSRI